MKFLILMIVMALAITANAECEVNGYYKANGTWVDGYTKSGECWNGEIIGYDAQGRTAKEREAIQVKENRVFIPFIVLLIILLAMWGEKVDEDSISHTYIHIVLFLAILNLGFYGFADPIIFLLIVPGAFFWNWMMKRKEEKEKNVRGEANSKYKEKLERNRATYDKVITYCNTHLSKWVKYDFIAASEYIIRNEDSKIIISRKLAIELYRIKQKEQLFNNKDYTVFTIMNLGVILKKVNNTAVDCYLVPERVALTHLNTNRLDDYFTEDDLFTEEDDLFG